MKQVNDLLAARETVIDRTGELAHIKVGTKSIMINKGKAGQWI